MNYIANDVAGVLFVIIVLAKACFAIENFTKVKVNEEHKANVREDGNWGNCLLFDKFGLVADAYEN